jgi:hypothetical protein
MEEKKATRTNWKTTDKRFVAFIDILGFKDLVSKNNHAEIYEQLSKISKTKKFLENIAENGKILEKYKDAEIYIVSFSDSIVIFSKNDDINNFYFFLLAVRWLFAKTIEAKIPIKGGLAHGEVSLNKSEQIYFGQAIIDAFMMEEDVNYIGVVAHNTIDNYININKIELQKTRDKLSEVLFEDKTPLKCGNINHLNLNWFMKAVISKEELTDIEKTKRINELITNFKYNTSGSPRKYIDNTIDFFNKNFENGNILL